MALKPFQWKEQPALIERLFPAGKISVESYKEQNARQGKTLTGLGSFWKGRKPLVLNKACILAALLPATNDSLADLEIFELLMGMDEKSMLKRAEAKLPVTRAVEAQKILNLSFREQVQFGRRAEEINEDILFSHIWEKVNKYLGTNAHSFSELVDQMGVARFGHRPKIADVFCGSGQIPFEAARLGCEVYASDLNPIACLLTWGAFHIVGGDSDERKTMKKSQKALVNKVSETIKNLGVERTDNGWRPKFYLYCTEVKCPETGWMVPVLASKIISADWGIVFDMVPDSKNKRYKIEVKKVENNIDNYSEGTYKSGIISHSPDGVRINFKISTIRGDFKENGETKNRLRKWEKSDFTPRKEDIFQERLYCILWIKNVDRLDGRVESEFRSITDADIECEEKIIDFVKRHLAEWQENGLVPDMVIERGYNTDQPIRERGWTYWHHLFNPRQLLIAALVNISGNPPALPGD